MRKLSGLVMTFNEEENIERCLQSMQGIVDEILVVDSHSTDRTVAIAENMGARIIQRPYPGFFEQRKFMIENALHDHVLVLDADELLSDVLRDSILAIKTEWPKDCYWCSRLSKIGDQWIRHGSYYPEWKMRLFDRRKFNIVGINPHDKLIPAVGATVSHLKGDILHYAYKDLTQRTEKMNGLSTHAARAYDELGKRGSWFRLLVKPISRFFIEYFIRLGFLDGFYGFCIARTSALYVFLRESKMMERQRKRSDETHNP